MTVPGEGLARGPNVRVLPSAAQVPYPLDRYRSAAEPITESFPARPRLFSNSAWQKNPFWNARR